MKIRAVDLAKTYQMGSSEIRAVNNVNLEISEPTFVAIVGPSGSGKSTLLNLIGLNDRPCSGKVYLDNLDACSLTENSRRRIRRLHMGFIFQTFNLLPTLSALENVEVPLALAAKPQKEQTEEATALLQKVGLTNRINHRPKQLSMGEMQRVAIARALANKPEIIIADEPTGELDSENAKEIVALLSQINAEKKTTVLVATHDNKVADCAQSVYTMRDGKLSQNK